MPPARPFNQRENEIIAEAVRVARLYLKKETDATSATTSSLQEQLDAAAVVPAGAILFTGDDAAPTGYVLCDGASLVRADYADLFAAIGTTYGAADGTHFNVPNLKGRVVVGLDAGQTEFDALGETGGAKTVTLDLTMIPAHTHTYNEPAAGVDELTAGAAASVVKTRTGGVASGSAGGGAAHNNLQPYLVLNGIIKT